MLKKLLKVHKRTPCTCPVPPKPPSAKHDESLSSALKIVHAGGIVESYYMAIPAAKIMENYPSFLLARPEVFKQPWNSLVKPDEILTPGKKFLLVPRRTVRKLRRRIRNPSKENSVSYSMSQSSNDVSTETMSQQKSDIYESSKVSNTSDSANSNKKKHAGKKHVTFSDIDVKHKFGSFLVEKKGKEGDSSRKSSNPPS